MGVTRRWTTKAGYEAVAYLVGHGTRRHYCGYVAVTDAHPLYNLNYTSSIPACLNWYWNQVQSSPVGKRGVINLLLATWRDSDKTPEVSDIVDVHGSITYSGTNDGYPVNDPNLTWFGFDCAHCDDTIERQNEDYVAAECEYMAQQFDAMARALPIPQRVA